MLIGLYTKDGDLELAGSTQGLLSLAEHLVREGETHLEIPLSTSGVDPYPYDGVLTQLSVKIGGEQPLYIGRTGATLGRPPREMCQGSLCGMLGGANSSGHMQRR